MNRKYLLFFCLLSLILVFTACGDATMDVKKDGSGNMEIELPNNDYYTVEDVKSELEASMEHEEGFSKLSVKEKKDKIIASFKFDNLETIDTYAYMMPVADFAIIESGRLDELVFVDDEVEFNEKSKEILIKLPSELGEFDSAKVILPGKVIAHSSNLDVLEKDTIEVTSYGDDYVVYSASALSSLLMWGIILFVLFIFFLVIAGGVIFLLIKKKKNQDSQSDDNNEVVNNEKNKDEIVVENVGENVATETSDTNTNETNQEATVSTTDETVNEVQEEEKVEEQSEENNKDDQKEEGGDHA